jgi:Fungal N-terminal domain of STAND proteins
MISDTTNDLEEHLQKIDNRLKILSSHRGPVSDEDSQDRERVQVEKNSTEQCLAICAQVSAQVSQFRPNVMEDVSTGDNVHTKIISTVGGLFSAKHVTANALQLLEDKLTATTLDLEAHLRAVDRRLHTLPLAESSSVEGNLEQQRIQKEKESVEQCLGICAEASQQADHARTNVFEDISVAEDGHQVLVSTVGDLITAKRVTAGPRSAQWIGQMSDDSLGLLSHNWNPVPGRGNHKV